MYSTRGSGCLFELQRVFMHLVLRIAAFLMRLITDYVVQVARAVAALCLGITREMIERTSLAWEGSGWPDIGFLPVHARWHYVLLGALLWVLGYFLVRISLQILGLAAQVTRFVLAEALHPVCVPCAPLALLLLLGASIGWLTYRSVDDPLTW